ncbi:phage protein [Magnetospirillum fulvum]|uniref:Phage protein n=1 Tax=Magnetospirillum fulvum MGU-K5 TaxID=1316936 RepID=S9SH89_MAGFU|nr:phage protein [Magnetospirillum fulvum]EPY03488.1 phage protein [Magnetospirillum fulvum MGU-K5]
MPVRTYQPSFTGGEVAPSLYARTDINKYAVGLRTCRNFFLHAHGGASTRPGFQFVAEVKDSSKKVRLIPFRFNLNQQYVLEFGTSYMRVIKDGGHVMSGGVPYEIAMPYTEADLPRLSFAGRADTMFLAHHNHAPRKLARTGHAAWTPSTIAFVPATPAPASVTATPSGSGSEPLSYKVTAISDETGEESLPSAVAACNGWTSSGWPAGGKVTISWTAVTGCTQYKVYKNDNGIYGFLGVTESTSFNDKNVTADVSLTPPGSRNPFTGAGTYPSTVEFYEQRLYWASSDTAPRTVWGSVVSSFTNLNVSRPARDDEAVTFTIEGGQVNEVRHLIPLGDMIALTSDAEWRVSGGGSGNPITPSSIKVKPQSYCGASHVRPIVIGNTILYVQDKGSIVRDLAYKLEVDGFTGSDLSVLSNHLFEGRQIVDWAYAQVPHSIVWAVRDDGVLLGLTYMREHEVWGWHRHDTDGAFESVCVVSEGAEDILYAVVRRTIGGQTRRYIERLHERSWQSIEDAFCVDSGLTYSGAPVTTVSGLDHLEGKTVAILADGDALTPQVVSGGKVTLPRPYSKVHVGLPYQCDLETLDIDVGMTQTGTVQARRKTVARVTLRLWQSREFKAGPSADKLTATKINITAYSAPVGLYSGDKELILQPAWNSNGRVLIRQDAPVPLTVLAIMPDIEIGG